MKKFFKVIALLMINLIFLPQVQAENPAAENYRKIFETDIFYLKFTDKWGRRILASDGEMRLERMNTSIGNLAYLNPLGTLFGGGEDKFPEVLCKDNVYYKFIEDNKALVCTQNDLLNENLDPRQGWNTVKQKLALPDELSVLYPEDPFATKSPLLSESQFSTSTQATIKDKVYDCDIYTRQVKNASGTVGAQIIYQLFYLENKLVRAETLVERNGTQYPVHEIEIEALSETIPENAFELKNHIKLFAAGVGDMNDLLEKPKALGEFENLQLGGGSQ